jgi:soluble lytic murein transglycosylase-like protein
VRLLISLSLAGAALAGEYAVLDTGFRLRADRAERVGEIVRLYVGAGVIELPAQSVVRLEPEEAVAAPEPQPEPPARRPEQAIDPRRLIEEAARRHGLPVELLDSIAAVESGYNPRAVSPKGAIGLMQLMPATAARLNADPADPAQNVDAAARHLRELLERYDYGLYRALAAYNAGAGAVDRHGWVPPYRETQLYVQRVAERFERLRRRQAKSAD